MTTAHERGLIDSFLIGAYYKIGKYSTINKQLYYSGNCVAFIKGTTGIWVDSCGWKTQTTSGLLNLIPYIEITKNRGDWFLNGKSWNGELINVTEFLKNDNITSN